MNIIDISHTHEIYTVSRLTREARQLLEENFSIVWIEGEISNFAAPHSGHWYFSLKDATSQVRCAMFKPQNRKINFQPADGTHVMVKARVSLYEGRGDFQLLVEHIEEIGEGKLQKAFEALKKRLQAAGLFAPEHKKPLPTMPQTIGVITSATGAAIRDILSVLKRRYRAAQIIIYPTLVQGEQAAPAIALAIQNANKRQECDILLLARGGGSLEDLWAFNEEIVANAIFQSVIPMVSGIGHEIDFTIADFVADLRAATPSAAAELATPDSRKLLQSLLTSQQQLQQHMKQRLQQCQQQLAWTNQHLQQQHPKRKLAEQAQHLDFCELTLVRLQTQLIQKTETQLKTFAAQLAGFTPAHLIHHLQHRLAGYNQQLRSVMTYSLNNQQQQLISLGTQLDALSPLATLQRGYAIARRASDHRVLHSATETKSGEKIQVRLHEGELNCVVE